MQPSLENPYGLQRPPFPPPAPWRQPAPVAAVPPPAVVPAVDASAKTAAIVLFVSSLAMLIGVGSHAWFTRGESGIGLFGVHECFAHACHTTLWSDLARAPGEYALFGYVGLLALAGAVALSIHAGVRLLQNQARLAKVGPLDACLGVAAFCTVSFWMRLQFGELGHRLSPGFAGFVAIAGVIAAGTIAHRTVRRLARS
jgi:hypothetical protein